MTWAKQRQEYKEIVNGKIKMQGRTESCAKAGLAAIDGLCFAGSDAKENYDAISWLDTVVRSISFPYISGLGLDIKNG